MDHSEAQGRPSVRSAAKPFCPMCGRAGAVHFQNLTDHLFGVSGEWTFRRCTGEHCGVLWLDPMPLQEDLPSLYQHYFTHEARAVRAEGLRASFERWLKRGVLQRRLGYDQGLSSRAARLLCGIAEACPSGADGFMSQAMFLKAPGDHGRLLEIGCGSGEELAAMRALGWTVLGTDFDPAAVAIARGRGLEVRLGGVECVRQEDGPFDAIYLGHVIEHVPDPLNLLERCRNLLREEGALVLVTPNTSGLGLRWFGPHWRGLEPPRHLSAFNPQSLGMLCTRAGLAVRSLRTSAKGARYILGMSLQIKSTARSGTPVRSSNLWVRVAALLLQLVERGLGMLRSDAGEEIVLFATRRAESHT